MCRVISYMHKTFFVSLLLNLLIFSDCYALEKKKPDEYNMITLYMENDIVRGTDSQYTSGVKLTWISKELRSYPDDDIIHKSIDHAAEKLSFMDKPGYKKNIYISIGQNIYTPEDIRKAAVIKDDRPYAGLSYMALGLISQDLKKMDSLEIDAGIIGPHSYAAKLQHAVHSRFGAEEAEGWRNQLKDELVLNLFYERKWRVLSSDSYNRLGYDVIPRAGLSFGNLLIAANLGIQLRFGINIPQDFGTIRIRAGSETNIANGESDTRSVSGSEPSGIHLFLGSGFFIKARDILLDGNTFTDSHSVDKNPVVYRFTGGMGIRFHRLKITISDVWESKNFKTQKKAHSYGSLTVSLPF